MVMMYIEDQEGEGMPVLHIPHGVLEQLMSEGHSLQECQRLFFGEDFVRIFEEQRLLYVRRMEENYRREFEQAYGVEWSEEQEREKYEESHQARQEYFDWIQGEGLEQVIEQNGGGMNAYDWYNRENWDEDTVNLAMMDVVILAAEDVERELAWENANEE
jgi:hypothetical protein